MKYRKLGKTNWDVSNVSLGVLQLEEAACAETNSNADSRIAAIRTAIDAGVNYLDLGFPYLFPVPEKACSFVKDALSGGYREKVKIAINIPARLVSSQEDMDRYLCDQLRWFGLDHADICIIDWIHRRTWTKLKDIGLNQWLDSVTSSGRTEKAGYYFHDEAHYLVPIGEYWAGWSVAKFEYSFMDERHHPGSGGIGIAQKQGLGIVASDIFKGSRLLRKIPDDIMECWASAPVALTPTEWCFRWTLNDRNVSTALISPATAKEALEKIRFAETCDADSLSMKEIIHIKKVRDAYFAKRSVPCPACRCCMPCPNDIDAPRILELLNDTLMYGDAEISKLTYIIEGHNKTDCIGCGYCQKTCPRHYPLIELQKKASDLFTKGKVIEIGSN